MERTIELREAENHRRAIDIAEDWRSLQNSIPFIKTQPGWEIKVIPPFGGAVARFLVRNESGKSASVYLDCFDRLGCYGEPYWEVYPVGDDVGRCPMADVESLVSLINKSFKD